MIESVLIQTNADGSFPTPNHYAVWYASKARGLDIRFYTYEDMVSEKVSLDRDTLVTGGVPCVLSALRRLGVEPTPFDYPEALQSFLGRAVWVSTLGDIRRAYPDAGPPCFVKPVEHKLFTGHRVSCFRDLIGTARFSDSTPVWVSEIRGFLSEFRFFVCRNAVVGMSHYRGDPTLLPDRRVVCDAVSAYANTAPVAYGLDFGVASSAATRLVEVNDAFSLGCYGLAPGVYLDMLMSRWQQLVGSR